MTTIVTPSRRRFLFGAAAVLAAPATVRVAQLMPISAPKILIPARPYDPMPDTVHYGRGGGGFTAEELRSVAQNIIEGYVKRGLQFINSRELYVAKDGDHLHVARRGGKIYAGQRWKIKVAA